MIAGRWKFESANGWAHSGSKTNLSLGDLHVKCFLCDWLTITNACSVASSKTMLYEQIFSTKKKSETNSLLSAPGLHDAIKWDYGSLCYTLYMTHSGLLGTGKSNFIRFIIFFSRINSFWDSWPNVWLITILQLNSIRKIAFLIKRSKQSTNPPHLLVRMLCVCMCVDSYLLWRAAAAAQIQHRALYRVGHLTISFIFKALWDNMHCN